MSQRFRDDPAARHIEDPGVHAGFTRTREGLVNARHGIRRVQSLVKGDSGARELALARTKVDEAEFWFTAAIQAVKSQPYPPKPSGPEWLWAGDVAGYLRADLADTAERAAVELCPRLGIEVAFDPAGARKEFRKPDGEGPGYVACEPDDDGAVEWWYVPIVHPD